MKYSFLTYQFCRYPLEYSFKMAQAYGFAGVEVWGARPHVYAYDLNDAMERQIQAWKKKYGVEISMYTPELLAYPYSLTSRLANERKETVQYLCRCVEVAAAMGTDKMQVTAPHPGYGIDRKSVWEGLVEGLTAVCVRAEALGVHLLMETLSPSEGNIITTAQDLSNLIEAVHSPAMSGMLDVVPPVIANEPFSEYFELLGSHMEYIHICNSHGATEFHMQLDDPRGVISIPDALALFKRYGYTGWCSLELLAPYFKDPEFYLAQAARVLHNCKK